MKLNKSKVRRMIIMKNEGMSLLEIAQRFGVTIKQAEHIIKVNEKI